MNRDRKVEETLLQMRSEAILPGISPVLGAEAEAIIVMSGTFEAGQAGGAETILLVEDEAFVRMATGEVLESAGYRMLIARTAADALNAQEKCSQGVDLLLADIVLPGRSGYELANEFRGLCPRARILLMSGYAEQLVGCELSACGGAHLAKPFSALTLLRRVRQALDSHPI